MENYRILWSDVARSCCEGLRRTMTTLNTTYLLAEIRAEDSRIRTVVLTLAIYTLCVLCRLTLPMVVQKSLVFIQCVFIDSTTCFGSSVRHRRAVHIYDDLVKVQTCSRMNYGTLYLTCKCICTSIISARQYMMPRYNSVLCVYFGGYTNVTDQFFVAVALCIAVEEVPNLILGRVTDYPQ
jgi:hypothetical protein